MREALWEELAERGLGVSEVQQFAFRSSRKIGFK
jgi:hypothetical protein